MNQPGLPPPLLASGLGRGAGSAEQLDLGLGRRDFLAVIWQGAVSWDPVAFSGDTVLVPCPGFRGGWVCWGGRRQEGRATRCAGFRGSWIYHQLTGGPQASRLTTPDLRHVASKTVPATLAQLTSRGLGEGPLRKRL